MVGCQSGGSWLGRKLPECFMPDDRRWTKVSDTCASDITTQEPPKPQPLMISCPPNGQGGELVSLWLKNSYFSTPDPLQGPNKRNGTVSFFIWAANSQSGSTAHNNPTPETRTMASTSINLRCRCCHPPSLSKIPSATVAVTVIAIAAIVVALIAVALALLSLLSLPLPLPLP